MFLLSLQQHLKSTYFFDGGNTTKAGIIDYLLENKLRYLLIDEIDKTVRQNQTFLLNLMETGIVSEMKFGKIREACLKTSVFARCNDSRKLSNPLLSRFFVVKLEQYTYEQVGGITTAGNMTANSSTASTSSDDYQTGYQSGTREAQNFNNNKTQGTNPLTVSQDEHLLNRACDGGKQYCLGLIDGFVAGVNQSPSAPAYASTGITGASPFQDLGANIPVISNLVGNKQTGFYHNENGVFIPWGYSQGGGGYSLCGYSQSYLLESCSSLTNPDGSLTSEGDKAFRCIQTGFALPLAFAMDYTRRCRAADKRGRVLCMCPLNATGE